MSRIHIKDAENQLQANHNQLWQAHNQLDEPPELFHYCSAQGLKGILESRAFFASDILSLNDSSEIVHGRDMVCELLRNDSTPLAEALCDGFQVGRGLLGLGEEWFAHVVCLCGRRNVLSQWRGYSGEGGFAIGLDSARLGLRVQQSEFALLKMVYDRDLQRTVLAKTIESFKAVFEDYGPESLEDANALLEKIGMILFQTFFYFKHPAFQEEDEWRLLLIEPKEAVIDRTRFRLRGADVVPYILLGFEPELVRTIVQGPGSLSGINDTSVRRLVDTLGFKHVKVEKSDIPLR